MEILHIWDQCGFAKNITRLNLGSSIELSRVGRLPEYGYASQAISAFHSPVSSAYMEYLKWEVKRNIKRNVVFETHTPFFFELFPELAHRTIFHAHGSEIRRTDSSGLTIGQVNKTTKFGLQNSPLTFYSTPDLEPIIKEFTSNYQWVPHYAIPKISGQKIDDRIDLFFASSWDTWKGANQVLGLIELIHGKRSGLNSYGIHLGELAQSALELGVTLLPTMSRKNFNRKLESSKVIIGQGFGSIGASELESILIGKQFFSFRPDNYWMKAYAFDDSDFMPELDLLERLSRLLDGDIESNGAYVTKVLRTHSKENIVAILRKAYSRLSD
jgi:hypothetical protein